MMNALLSTLGHALPQMLLADVAAGPMVALIFLPWIALLLLIICIVVMIFKAKKKK